MARNTPKNPLKRPKSDEEDYENFRLKMLLVCGQDAPEPVPVSLIQKTPQPAAKSVKLYYTNKLEVKSIAGLYKLENSDKVYFMEIVKEPKYKDTWYVDFKYGKRNSSLRDGRKTKIAVAYQEACRIFDAILTEKKDEGYTTNVDGKPHGGVFIDGVRFTSNK